MSRTNKNYSHKSKQYNAKRQTKRKKEFSKGGRQISHNEGGLMQALRGGTRW